MTDYKSFVRAYSLSLREAERVCEVMNYFNALIKSKGLWILVRKRKDKKDGYKE